MKTYRTFYLILFIILLSACELRMAPTEYWSKLFRTQTDSSYYQGKSETLANQIAKDIEDYEINTAFSTSRKKEMVTKFSSN